MKLYELCSRLNTLNDIIEVLAEAIRVADKTNKPVELSLRDGKRAIEYIDNYKNILEHMETDIDYKEGRLHRDSLYRM